MQYRTDQKFLRVVNFVDFAVSLQNAKIITTKMTGQLVMWLLIMPAIHKIYFLEYKNLNKSVKFIAHKIFALYGITSFFLKSKD